MKAPNDPQSKQVFNNYPLASELRYMVIVNGYPRAGKDTLVEFMCHAAARAGLMTATHSTIDTVRAMLAKAGVDTSKKTPEDRKLLAAVGAALEEHSGFRTKEAFHRFFQQDPGTMTFVHMRELDLIDKLERRIGNVGPKYGLYCATLFVDRAEAALQEFSNPSDAKAGDSYPWDIVVANNGTLGQLYDQAEKAVQWIIKHGTTSITRRLNASADQAAGGDPAGGGRQGATATWAT